MAFALALLTPAGASAQVGAGSFNNPVIPGNVADPSVVRVDGAYWAAATSGDWAPVFPIFRSDDLQSWRQVGAVYSRPPGWARGKFWAPGLGVHDGVWSVYYSASRRPRRPCIAVAQARSPRGPWRDRGLVVCQPTGSIDAAPVTDAQGRRYLVWKRMGAGNGIYGARLSADGRRLTSEPVRLIVPNEKWEEGVTEGPDVVAHDGGYVLVYSGGHCCRPPCTYAVGVARADNVLGRYRKYAGNPVFRGGNGWKCPGHGTIVGSPEGTLSFLHHAYRSDDPFNVHRQALLDPVVFGEDGWPGFGASGAPVGAGAAEQSLELRDTFSGRALAQGWQWRYDARPALQVRGGRLRLLRGAISRAWAPRTYAAEATVAGRGRLALLFSRSRRQLALSRVRAAS